MSPGYGGAVEGEHGLAGAARGLVNLARHHLFAGRAAGRLA